MVQYIVPLSSLLLSFLATLACLRFIFSRQGFFWIIPVVVSVLLTMSNGFNIFLPAISLLPLTSSAQLFSLFLSFFWYMMIVTFHYALKRKVSRNRFLNDMKKNYTESSFIEKAENRDYRTFTRRKKKKTMNSYYQPEIGEYHNDTGSLDE